MPKLFTKKVINVQFSSQWELIWYKFVKHRAAFVSLFVLVFIYIAGFFCEFISPYDPATIFSSYIYAPPQLVHVYGDNGFSRPFVYGYTSKIDPTTLQRIYVPDRSKVFPLKFLSHGEPYKLWGIFKNDIHLFGVDVEKGEYLFLLGTDRMGRDMMSRIVSGTRVSTSIGLLGVFFSFVLGTLLGGLSGFYGGMIDNAIQRITEFLRSIPTIPLWLGLTAAMPATWSSARVYFMIVIILSFIGWTGLARVVRSKFMSLRNEDFVMAAKLAGASDGRIILRHLVPSFSSHIIASLTLAIPEMIISETALSFLGLGLRPPIVSWGVLLQEAQNIRTVAMSPWLLIPAFAVIITVFCFNFLGDGLRDAADPYSGQGRL